MTDFWQLPAPATFLRRVFEDIREGNNVVIAIPDHGPEGWPAALRAVLARPALPQLSEIQVNGEPPLQDLHRVMLLGTCPRRPTVTDLCANPNFRGRLVHLKNISSANCLPWVSFLAEYEDACRRFELVDRTLFIATFQGEVAAQVPTPANLLRVHRWIDQMDGLNARLFAANLLSSSQMPAWHRHLAVTLLAELALWDPEVTTFGASQPIENLSEPAAWLKSLASGRDWPIGVDLKSPTAQWRGLRQPFEGQLRTHSAWLAISNRTYALARRVWTAHVSVLFPLLERHRRAILLRYGSLLRVPWNTPFASVSRVEDLELNHIADQLASQRAGSLRGLVSFVSWLRDIRNDLAHLNPVPASRLFDSRFVESMGNLSNGEDD